MKEFAKGFYNGVRWRKCREAYIKHRVAIDGGLCEKCHEELGYIVHHKVELTPDTIKDPDIAFGFDNLMYECKYCHDREEGHFIGPGGELRVRFDAEGNVIPVSPR